MNINIIDIIILVPLLYGFARGLWRGFVSEVVATGALAVGIVCAKIFAKPLAEWLTTQVTWSMSTCELVAYAVIFVAATMLLSMVGWMLSKLMKAIKLGWLNHLLGGVFGTLKWALILSLLINVFDLLDGTFHFIQPEVKSQSIGYEPLRKVASVAWESVKPASDINLDIDLFNNQQKPDE